MQGIHLLICQKLELDPLQVLKKKIRGLEGFNVGELISSLVYSNSLEEAAELLGYTVNPIKQCTKTTLIPLFPNRGKQFGFGGGSAPWYFLLLSSIQYKKCSQCESILPYHRFHSNTHNSDNLSSECGGCKTHAEKLRKALILKRVPSWAEIKKIRDFYNSCPQGHHVDHIIPLNGVNVSGFHILSNLQYLTAEDNLKKSNSFIVE